VCELQAKWANAASDTGVASGAAASQKEGALARLKSTRALRRDRGTLPDVSERGRPFAASQPLVQGVACGVGGAGHLEPFRRAAQLDCVTPAAGAASGSQRKQPATMPEWGVGAAPGVGAVVGKAGQASARVAVRQERMRQAARSQAAWDQKTRGSKRESSMQLGVIEIVGGSLGLLRKRQHGGVRAVVEE
jgi:hypothetical protein